MNCDYETPWNATPSKCTWCKCIKNTACAEVHTNKFVWHWGIMKAIAIQLLMHFLLTFQYCFSANVFHCFSLFGLSSGRTWKSTKEWHDLSLPNVCFGNACALHSMVGYILNVSRCNYLSKKCLQTLYRSWSRSRVETSRLKRRLSQLCMNDKSKKLSKIISISKPIKWLTWTGIRNVILHM